MDRKREADNKTSKTSSTGDNEPAENVNTIEVMISIDTGSKSYEYKIQTEKNQSAFGVIKKASKKEGFSLNYDTDPTYGAYPCIIHDVGVENCMKNYPGFYWRFSVNGKSSNVGISSYIVLDGDKLGWEYTDQF